MMLLGGVAAWPRIPRAQQPKRLPRLCFLTLDQGTAQAPTTRFEAFFQRLRELGYVNGQTIIVDYLSAYGRPERYPSLAAECVRLNPDVIAVTTTPGARALKAATRTIPIIMIQVGDPVGTGLVETLARPGGNITGMSTMTAELAAKRLQLMKEAVPRISRVLVLSYLVDPIAPLQVRAMKEIAPSLGMTLLVHEIRTAADIAPSFEAAAKEGAQGLVTGSETIFRAERARVADLAARYKLPAVYPYSEYVTEANGLMAYEIAYSDLHRSAATYIDMILKGAKPAELPVQQPSKFRLVVNLKTARSLPVAIPESFLARADALIE